MSSIPGLYACGFFDENEGADATQQENEQIKDIRLMLDMISKDLARLSTDVKCLGDCLKSKGDKNVGDV